MCTAFVGGSPVQKVIAIQTKLQGLFGRLSNDEQKKSRKERKNIKRNLLLQLCKVDVTRY